MSMPIQQEVKTKGRYRLIVIALNLPFICLLCLLLVFGKKLNIYDQLLSFDSIFIIGTLTVSLLISIFLLSNLLHGIQTINSKLKEVLPLYKLSQIVPNNLKKSRDPLKIFGETYYMIEGIGAYIRNLNLKKEHLEDSHFKVKIDSIYDALCSNIYNRRHTESLIAQKIENLEPSKGLAVAILDIDYFKKVNDTYGHDCGDFVLKEICTLIYSSLREEDILGRWGGEEFCVLLEVNNVESAQSIFERARTIIEQTALTYINNSGESMTLQKTISIGFTLYRHEHDVLLDDIIKKADTALYHAKTSGRNRITYFPLQ